MALKPHNSRQTGKYTFWWSGFFIIILAASATLNLACDDNAMAKEVEKPSFEQRLTEALSVKAFDNTEIGFRVVGANDGRVVFERGGDKALNPASNLKILTAAAALETLGSAYTFSTQIFADAPLDENGTLNGNLYIKGHGDPELVFEEVYKLAQDMKALGMKEVEGDLVADSSFFDHKKYIQGWDADHGDLGRAYYAPISALSFNFNTVSILVAPGAKIGDPAKVTLETPTAYVNVTNETKTTSQSRGLSVQRSKNASNQGSFIASGAVSVKAKPRRFYRAIGDPEAFALALFKEQLVVAGISIKGRSRVGTVSKEAILLHQLSSSSLDVLLKYMNKISSNFIAEHILKTMGAEQLGVPGSTDKGVKVIEKWLESHKIWNKNVAFFNGSGLSQKTQVPPSVFTDVLRMMLDNKFFGWEFVSTLPIAGVDGTLKTRMRNGPGKGLVRAKTGSIDGVYAMSGYVFHDNRETLIFSLLVNNTHAQRSATRSALEGVISVLVDGEN